LNFSLKAKTHLFRKDDVQNRWAPIIVKIENTFNWHNPCFPFFIDVANKNAIPVKRLGNRQFQANLP